eukprot:g1353.t1
MTSAPQEAPYAPVTTSAAARFDFTWKSPDGLTLAGKDWPAPDGSNSSKIPLLCLPGLSRNTRDFEELALYLQSQGHRVVALDYRGRGASDWDEDWRNYALPVEEKDIDAALETIGLEKFALLGTSRGGLHALILGARYPADRMAAVIFNDVGPHIEMKAIHRIAATLGHHMKNTSLEEVAGNLKRTLGTQFPSFETTDWLKLAGQLASERDGAFVMDYDPALAHQLASLDDAAPAPDLWPLYENLLDRPVMVLRGEHSDLLSEETCQRMITAHPNATSRTIPGQGHAPVLWDEETQTAIAAFLNSV